jgi:hypothetical protein
MFTCLCGASLPETKQNNCFKSLPNVLLVNQSFYECDSCNESYTLFPKLDNLIDLLFDKLNSKPKETLTPYESLFLIKELNNRSDKPHSVFDDIIRNMNSLLRLEKVPAQILYKVEFDNETKKWTFI